MLRKNMTRSLCIYPSDLDYRRIRVMAEFTGMSMSAFIIDLVRTNYAAAWGGASIDYIERMAARTSDGGNTFRRADGVSVRRKPRE